MTCAAMYKLEVGAGNVLSQARWASAPTSSGQRARRADPRDCIAILPVIVNVPPADDEQVARVPKTGEQEKRRVQAG